MNMKISDLIAHIFSILLSPFLMMFYSISLLYTYTSFFEIYPGQALKFLIPVFVFSCFIPVVFIILLKMLRIIKDVSLSEQRDRVLPYLMTAFANLMLLYYFYTANIYIWFLAIIGAGAITALVGLIINFFWKISAHMLGIGALIGSVLSVCYNVKAANPFIIFIILFILAGCLGVSRLHLNKSTAAQVYGGCIIGGVVSYFSLILTIFAIAALK